MTPSMLPQRGARTNRHLPAQMRHHLCRRQARTSSTHLTIMTITNGAPKAASSGVLADAERLRQKDYWTEHSKEATVEAMMLDSCAKTIDAEERPEVLAMLGSIKGKKALELGAGIGRFTGSLAAEAKHLIALDFMENLIQENKRINGSLGNIEFRAGDALQLSLPDGSLDVAFSNWLLMYLGDEEVQALAANVLDWVVEGGIFFFRESCFRQSGDKQRKSNPTHYRNPKVYFGFMDALEHEEADGRFSHWELVSCKCVDTYVRVKKNQNQICWKWRKVCTTEPRGKAFRHFLDGSQYQVTGILRYEKIFGEGYVSTGGAETTKEFVKMLDLQSGQRVLDVGCGIGGGDFYMAAQHDVFVHGIDLSVNMVLLALERAAGMSNGGKVSFEIADCMVADYPEGRFDVIYSRDTILHIHDKPALFDRFFRWLKPGGKLLVSDYCKGPGEPSDSFAAYIRQRGYDLHTPEAYGKLLEGAGFTKVKAEDRTWQFEESLQREVKQAQDMKGAFLEQFSQEDFDAIVTGWNDKLKRVADGEQRWGLFQAMRP